MKEIPLYRNQSFDLQSKSMDWFLYDRDIRCDSWLYNYYNFIKILDNDNTNMVSKW